MTKIRSPAGLDSTVGPTPELVDTGFHKVAANRWEFSNKLFRRGERDKLREICRKKATYSKPQLRLSSELADEPRILSASSEVVENLICENKRLRRENNVLSSELAAMKNKFEELLDLATVYGESSDKQEADENGPMVFGVRLGVLRGEREK
ncbi:Heat stress transcription factor B-3 [Striga hermonthica]|uniref:Heat stress transcription factor B-3 n=1 Tax=Striga hermonthica TaxID=68872 RepID=A0A9N7RGD8_STRHE|nr:Heat stress transcription factor B-3 [Striga hermonthica]